jgi:hypothetical protein
LGPKWWIDVWPDERGRVKGIFFNKYLIFF